MSVRDWSHALAEARAQFSEIASALAQAGEGEVIVTRYGRPLVKIVPTFEVES